MAETGRWQILRSTVRWRRVASTAPLAVMSILATDYDMAYTGHACGPVLIQARVAEVAEELLAAVSLERSAGLSPRLA